MKALSNNNQGDYVLYPVNESNARPTNIVNKSFLRVPLASIFSRQRLRIEKSKEHWRAKTHASGALPRKMHVCGTYPNVFWIRSAIPLIVGLALIGCGEVDRSSQFIPSPKVAESAVTLGMEAWSKGEPAGIIAGTKPVIYVVDSHRKPGQTLDHFEILGEVSSNGPRCFAVKARLTNPEKEERLRYVVVGIDPIWVFLQEDYELLCHWDHPMEEPKPTENSKK